MGSTCNENEECIKMLNGTRELLDDDKFRRSDIGRIILCVLSGTIFSINMRSFVSTGNLLPGGFAGLTILIQNIVERFLGISLPYGPVYIGLNAAPIIMSYMKIGKKYTAYSCITIALITVLTDVIPQHVITYDILLIAIFGGMINGFAVSLSLRADATTGGTDFVAIWISEKFGVDSFNYVLAFNAIVLFFDGFLFGWEKSLYSIIFQFTSTQIIHVLYNRYKKNTLFIITDSPKAVTDKIYELTGHGATDIKAYGSYENASRTIVYSVVSSEELKKVVSAVHKIDEGAFLNVMKTEQLMGNFHMHPTD
jgi:uncharacterized membrane-anchored protein YitT (DUF2179 family)